MATNDVNLQVINSMTQDKMNSLKNADGKIPSLANQIIMTDEEDANLGYKLYAHHLYLISSNTRIWVTITTETEDVFTQSTFHKWLYDKGFNGTTTNTSGNWLSVNGGFRSEKTNISAIASNNSTSGDFVVIATTSSGTTPTAITVTEFSDMVKLINPQPAMIYTGAELHEGDGISIENGTISSKTTRITLYQGNISSATNFSLSDSLSNYKFVLFTAYDNFNNYVTTMIDVSTLRVHSTKNSPIGISSSSSTVDRYAEVYYVNETQLGILTPKNMSLRFVEGLK